MRLVKSLIGIYGASGFGREVMPLLHKKKSEACCAKLVFIDDSTGGTKINGYECVTFKAFTSHPAENRYASIAVADGKIRERLTEKCASAGIRFLNIAADTATIMDNCHIGEGSIMSPFSTVTSNVTIGRHFHMNLYSYVGHDCVIGDYVTFAPSVKCNGNVRIENHAYIGTGAILRQGTPDKPLIIGAGAVVGMGAVVTRDVPAGVTVVGNPAKPMIKG